MCPSASEQPATGFRASFGQRREALLGLLDLFADQGPNTDTLQALMGFPSLMGGLLVLFKTSPPSPVDEFTLGNQDMRAGIPAGPCLFGKWKSVPGREIPCNGVGKGLWQ